MEEIAVSATSLHRKIQFEGHQRSLLKAWKILRTLRSLEYQCFFSSPDALQFVLDKGSWNVGDRLLILRRWQPGVPYSHMDFDKVYFWINIVGLPREFYTVEVAKKFFASVVDAWDTWVKNCEKLSAGVGGNISNNYSFWLMTEGENSDRQEEEQSSETTMSRQGNQARQSSTIEKHVAQGAPKNSYFGHVTSNDGKKSRQTHLILVMGLDLFLVMRLQIIM
ncbi:OLC1v1028599C1 [Oldenlandia corymbosa var. corymbosa]|uniref:OLC1v1028599C1 n=1 Tax=Oldenlandia corymbosa var. corymbosa TaxID=529605 RepID=A0AAV1CD82_OLDCO|nr:OLC1v1028599C1 [Oldenlandia corymbosa var. corymbosa]